MCVCVYVCVCVCVCVWFWVVSAVWDTLQWQPIRANSESEWFWRLHGLPGGTKPFVCVCVCVCGCESVYVRTLLNLTVHSTCFSLPKWSHKTCFLMYSALVLKSFYSIGTKMTEMFERYLNSNWNDQRNQLKSSLCVSFLGEIIAAYQISFSCLQISVVHNQLSLMLFSLTMTTNKVQANFWLNWRDEAPTNTPLHSTIYFHSLLLCKTKMWYSVIQKVFTHPSAWKHGTLRFTT